MGCAEVSLVTPTVAPWGPPKKPCPARGDVVQAGVLHRLDVRMPSISPDEE